MTKSETALVGMAEISAYVQRSEKTVLDIIKNEGFPAKKLGGIWESDTLLIDKWRRKRINQEREIDLRARSM